LIKGESGTGKELIARSINARSNRKTKAFVPVVPPVMMKPEVMAKFKNQFIDGAVKNDIPKNIAEKIFELMEHL